MYVIVVGAGLIGSTVTKRLVDLHHDVVVIDNNRQVCEQIYAEYGAMTINGDATKISDLKEAGISKADKIVCCLRSDSDNIAVSLLAKSLKIPEVVACVRKNQYLEAYKLAGVNDVVKMTDILIDNIIFSIVKPTVSKLYSFGYGKAEMHMISLTKDSFILGKSIIEVIKIKDFPKEIIFTGIYRKSEDRFYIPTGYSVFELDDVVFITGEREDIHKLIDILS